MKGETEKGNEKRERGRKRGNAGEGLGKKRSIGKRENVLEKGRGERWEKRGWEKGAGKEVGMVEEEKGWGREGTERVMENREKRE
jgi:hypothetical protein